MKKLVSVFGSFHFFQILPKVYILFIKILVEYFFCLLFYPWLMVISNTFYKIKPNLFAGPGLAGSSGGCQPGGGHSGLSQLPAQPDHPANQRPPRLHPGQTHVQGQGGGGHGRQGG